jgi:CRP-like cAMP-binding protein
VEAGVIGREGMLGTALALGAETTPHLALVQAKGHALKMAARDLRAEIQKDGVLLDLILRYTNALFTQVAQTAACNRLHTIEQRLARWLPLTHDRVQHDEFELTQEFLSRMLGVRRAGVSVRVLHDR